MQNDSEDKSIWRNIREEGENFTVHKEYLLLRSPSLGYNMAADWLRLEFCEVALHDDLSR